MLIVDAHPLMGGIRPAPDVGRELIDDGDSASRICRECGLDVACVEAVDKLADGSTL